MNLNTIGVVISREYATRVKKKSFLIITFLVPVLFAALCCIPAFIMLFSKDDAKTLAVIDHSGIVMQTLESNEEFIWEDCSTCVLDTLKANFDNLPYAGIVYVSALNADNSVSVSTYSKDPIGIAATSALEHAVTDAVEDYRINQYDISGLKDILETVRPDIEVKSYTIGEDGEDKISNAGVYMFLSMGLGIIIFMFVTMFSASVMQSVVEEKQSKVVEVLLSSVNALDLMFGKIIGVALVALTQFFLWIALTAVLVSGVFFFVGKDSLMGTAPQAAQMQMMSGVDTDAVAAVAQDPTAVQEIMQTLSGINYGMLLGSFFLFFIFGYLLYASLFAAIGSAVESVEDSNNLQMPLTVPLMLAYFIAIYSWNAPNSAIAVWGSMIPFTSPIVMLSRIPFGVPAWQVIVSLLLLVATFAAMAWVSAKIYRIGILTSGKKANWKDLWKWLIQK
ncbi:MAG: ABC transporter permease [Bacteroidales bacterium]|nr:ABC transporter permease [Bacteroidales bacterium]